MLTVIFSTLGQEGQSGSERATEALRRQMLSILDTAVSEMENRFSTKNLELMKALSCLMPKSNKFLDIHLLEPLCGLAGVAKNELQNEILVARPMLSKKLPTDADCSAVCKLLQEYKDAFAGLHKLYVSAVVMGASTASCESSFSTLARILTPFRRTMLHERKKSLVLLAHEKAITHELDMDEFVTEFSKTSRKLML